MNRRMKKLSIGFCGSVLLLSGCQTGLNGFPNLSTLNSPTRIPPPATGAYAAPQGYGAPGVSGPTSSTNLKPVGATLAQLRSLESGKDAGDVFGSEGRIPSNDVQQNSVTARPVVGSPITPLQALMGSPDQSVKTASASFAGNSSASNIQMGVPSQTSNAKVTYSELPDPRGAVQESELSISNGVAWKSAAR